MCRRSSKVNHLDLSHLYLIYDICPNPIHRPSPQSLGIQSRKGLGNVYRPCLVGLPNSFASKQSRSKHPLFPSKAGSCRPPAFESQKPEHHCSSPSTLCLNSLLRPLPQLSASALGLNSLPQLLLLLQFSWSLKNPVILSRNMEAFCDFTSPLQVLFSTGRCCNVNDSSFKLTGHYPLKLVRTRLAFSQKLFICRARFADSGIEGSFNLKLVSPALLAAEKEEAKAVLVLFLKKQGLSHTIAARIINKSELFIDHLVARLHSVHKSRYLVGRELTTLEIREALIPYLESLLEEHGVYMVDVVESFPDAPVKAKPVAPVIKSQSSIDSKKSKAMSRVSEIGPGGNLPPHIIYLLELGMDIDQIKGITRRFPSFAYYSLEGKIRPTVEFLLDLGVPKSDIPSILFKRPQLCGISLYENIMPTMRFLENLGVDKKQWAKVIYRFPALLTYSRQKVKTTVDFLYEMGHSEEMIGKVLTRCPNIISYSVEEKLRPTAEYFRSLGVDVGVLLHRSPTVFGLSIEGNLKPVTEFFREKGYTMVEIGTMISRYGALYTFSLTENLKPKWEFFLTMDYAKSELVKFPQYFGYSLVERIEPRYALMKECGVMLLLNQLLSLSAANFDKALKKKIEKMAAANSDDPNTDVEV